METDARDSSRRLRWTSIYCEAELYKAALRVYTKPLFQWRKALSTSTDERTLYDLAARGIRGMDQIHQALQRQSFTFRPAVALHYNFNGKERTLYISPWEDRIVDLLLYRTLNHKLHAWFSPNSYAYRERAYGLDHCQTRIIRILRALSAPVYVIKRDIADYFASVDHEIFLQRLTALVDPNDYLFHLLEQRVRFSYQYNGPPERAAMGIPFGSAVACLFANIYLTEVDRKLEEIAGISYFRYADDFLILSRSPEATLVAAKTLGTSLAVLKLTTKRSHELNCVLVKNGEHAESVFPANPVFSATPAFRHLGLQFSADGGVTLSRDKCRKVQNLFRFGFRRSRSRWRKITDPWERAQALSAIAADIMAKGVRNVAIVDYYLRHVDNDRQLHRLDRWLAEEVLSLVFAGHRRGNFAKLSFSELRAMGLPSLVHRRRLILHRRVESPFFIWQGRKFARARKGTVARLLGASSAHGGLLSRPRSSSQQVPVREGGCL
jgi:hypothetical protein